MKSRAPLALIEAIVMLAVFALAAALCLQAFVKSDQMSRENEARDRAIAAGQTVAETLKGNGGDFARTAEAVGGEVREDGLTVDYAEDWSPAADALRYTLGVARVESGVPGLGLGELWVRDEASETELVRFQVAWQEEVTGYGG